MNCSSLEESVVTAEAISNSCAKLLSGLLTAIPRCNVRTADVTSGPQLTSFPQTLTNLLLPYVRQLDPA